MRRLAIAAAVAGAVDSALFLATRTRLFREAPGRAAGTVAGITLWGALAARSVRTGRGRDGALLGLAGANAAANTALLAVHLRHGIAGPRVWLGAGLAAVSLAGALG